MHYVKLWLLGTCCLEIAMLAVRLSQYKILLLKKETFQRLGVFGHF